MLYYYHVVLFQKNKGVKIIAVGIGNNINGAFLTKVAGKNGNVIRVKNFNALTAKIGELLERGCGEWNNLTEIVSFSLCITHQAKGNIYK